MSIYCLSDRLFLNSFFLLKYSSCVFICSFVSLAVCVCVCYAVLVSCLDLMKSDWYQIQHVVHAVNRICLFELEKKNSTWIKKYTPNIDDKWFLHMQQHIWAQLIENTNSNKVVWRKMRFIQSFRAQTRNIRTARNTNANIFDEQEQKTEEENCFCFWCFFGRTEKKLQPDQSYQKKNHLQSHNLFAAWIFFSQTAKRTNKKKNSEHLYQWRFFMFNWPFAC